MMESLKLSILRKEQNQIDWKTCVLERARPTENGCNTRCRSVHAHCDWYPYCDGYALPSEHLNVAHASRFSTHHFKTQLFLMRDVQNETTATWFVYFDFSSPQKAYLFCGMDLVFAQCKRRYNVFTDIQHFEVHCRSNIGADYCVFIFINRNSSPLTSTFNSKGRGWDMSVSVKFTYVHEHFKAISINPQSSINECLLSQHPFIQVIIHSHQTTPNDSLHCTGRVDTEVLEHHRESWIGQLMITLHPKSRTRDDTLYFKRKFQCDCLTYDINVTPSKKKNMTRKRLACPFPSHSILIIFAETRIQVVPSTSQHCSCWETVPDRGLSAYSLQRFMRMDCQGDSKPVSSAHVFLSCKCYVSIPEIRFHPDQLVSEAVSKIDWIRVSLFVKGQIFRFVALPWPIHLWLRCQRTTL